MEHKLAKILLITEVTELIAAHYRLQISDARERLYDSDIINFIDDDETGLYGESPLYIFSLFEQEQKQAKHIQK